MNKLFLIVLLLSFIACENEKRTQVSVYEKTQSLNRNHTLDIPTSLLKKLNQDFFELSLRPVERTETQKEVALKNTSRNFLNFSAYLLDKGDVLFSKSTRFNVDGGGEVDLDQYVKPNAQGDFILGFILDDKYTADNTKVYFISNLKSSGCNKYIDITDYFFNDLLKNGLLTTTKNYIHIKLLIGAYVFISNIDDQYYLGQFYVSSNKLKTLMCR